MAAPDPLLYRSVMGAFPTGVAIITTARDDGYRCGVTVSSFNTVSIEPPLILWSLSLRAPSYEVFRDANHFSVNILAADQAEVALQFARPADDKFSGIELAPDTTVAPLIRNALAHIECRLANRFPGGDHEIMLGEVLKLRQREGQPLVFQRGAFRTLQPV